MLNLPAPFPQPGAHCFMRPDAAPVRIIRRNLDGSALVARQPQSGMTGTDARLLRTIASGNTTVPLSDLFATAEEAITPARKRRGRRAA